MPPAFEIHVECYSGYKADERPLRFTMSGRTYEVAEVIDQWYGPNDIWFRVKASDGNTYILRHTTHAQSDTWTLESFHQG